MALDLDRVLPDYPIPDYLTEGMEVYAPYDDARCIRCKVLIACGDAGRVVNEQHNYDRWVSRWHLRIKKHQTPIFNEEKPDGRE